MIGTYFHLFDFGRGCRYHTSSDKIRYDCWVSLLLLSTSSAARALSDPHPKLPQTPRFGGGWLPRGGVAWRCTPTQPRRLARSCQPAKALQLRQRRGIALRGLALALERTSPGQPLAARATARASSQQRRRGTPAPPLSSPRCGAPSPRRTGDPAILPTLGKASPRTATRAPQRSGPAPRPASAHARRTAAAA